MAYTKDYLLKLAKKIISSKNRNIDLSTGGVIEDIGVDAQAEILANISSDVERVKNQRTLDSQYFTDEEADLLVLPLGITRNPSTKATGNVTFGALSLPNESNPIIIPTGTKVYGTPGDGSGDVYYVTTSIGTLTSNSPYNSQTGYYETTVSVEAVSPGVASNLGIGYINKMGTNISGISAVYNKNAFVDGADTESTDSLLNRYKLTLRGRNYNTKPGLLAWTLSNPKVKEAVIIDPRSPYSLRGPGAVDVYVRGGSPAQYVQTVTSMTKEVYFDVQPVIHSDNSIYVTINDVIYYEGDDVFNFVKDEETIFQSSSSARDKIVFTENGYNLIKNLESYTITYSYNSLISELQSMFDNSDDALITGDVLARSTYEVGIVMEFGITPETGYDKNATITLVKSNIQNYINTLPLNTPVRQSDIIAIIEDTDGVSFTSLPFLQFHRVGELDTKKWVADMEATPLEYFRIDSDNIIIG